jgi:nicotinate-nucleotide--dimethylbenzimidazole phosphoribosyltransferase
MFASHRSAEKGHRAVLSYLKLRPLLDLGLRLGEGTGAVLAMTLIETAAACLSNMATFGEAGVSDREDEQVLTSEPS